MSLFKFSLFLLYSRFSGIEYLFVHDVSKIWNKEIHISKYYWEGVRNHLINNTADIGLCSMWITQDHFARFDMSTYFDFQCITLLVPKPVPMNEATFVYKSLTGPVWIYFSMTFIGMGLLLNYFTKLGLRLGLYENLHGSTVYVDLTRSFLEIINTVSAHGAKTYLQFVSFRLIILRYFIVFSLCIFLYFLISSDQMLTVI